MASGFNAAEFQKPPFDFLFGNHIDTHQETKLKFKKGELEKLRGYLYVIFIGFDDELGIPIARHPRGEMENEECGVDVDCIAGWELEGRPSQAKFLYHSGVNGEDHPVWMLNRSDIPQPGSFTHFHWITSERNDDPRNESVPEECEAASAGELESDPSAVNVTCPGWLLELTAVEEFLFQHAGEMVHVRPGVDNATHLNLVTNYSEVSAITSTGMAHP